MTNHITDLLNLKDSDIQIKSISTHGNIKEITLEKRISSHYCPLCNFKMHSLGIYVRTVNHPILQDGFILKLLVRHIKEITLFVSVAGAAVILDAGISLPIVSPFLKNESEAPI